MPVGGKVHQIKALLADLEDDINSFEGTMHSELTALMERFTEFQDVVDTAKKTVSRYPFCTTYLRAPSFFSQLARHSLPNQHQLSTSKTLVCLGNAYISIASALRNW